MEGHNGLSDVVFKNIQSFAYNVALIYDTGQEKFHITYGELGANARKVSDALKKCQVTGEVVGLCVHQDQHLPSLLLGTLHSDAAFYYFEPGMVDFVVQVIQELAVRILIIDVQYLQDLENILFAYEGKITADALDENRNLLLVELRSVSKKHHHGNLAYCITTSGTTGTPKVVRVPHRCILPNIHHIRTIFNTTTDDLVFLTSPLTFDPSIVEIFTALSSGASLLMTTAAVKAVPDLLLRVVHHRNRVTVMQATPTLMYRMDPVKLSQTLLGEESSLRVLSLGGERFPACSVIRRWRATGNHTMFFNMYGSTEVSCWATFYQVTEEDMRRDEEVPLGRPLSGTVVQVVDEGGTVVKEGAGRVLIGGTDRQCILSEEEECLYEPSQVRLRETGDFVQVTGDGWMLYKGRRDDQIKRYGRRLNLTEIPLVLKLLEGVKDSCAVMSGDQLQLLVIPTVSCHQPSVMKTMLPSNRQGSETNSSQELEQTVREHLQSYLPLQYQPDAVMVGESMPVTSHGKVDKTKLSEMFSVREVERPSSIVACLETAWKELLQMDQSTTVTENERFIDKGGNSFQAVQLLTTLETCCGTEQPELLDLILHATYGVVIEYLIARTTSSDHPEHVPQTEKELKRRLNETKNDNEGKEQKETATRGHKENESKAKESTCTGEVDDETDNDSVSERKVKKMRTLIPGERFIAFLIRGNRYFYTRVTDSVCKGVHIHNNSAVAHSDEAAVETMKKTRPCAVTKETSLAGPVQLQLEECWRFSTGKCVDASPLLAQTRNQDWVVYIGSHSHRFCAISMTTGLLLWETMLGDRVESSACLSRCGTYVVVGCYDGNVYAMMSDNGDIWWTYQTGGEVKSSPVVDMATGLMFVGSHSRCVYCLDVKSKVCVWKRDLDCGSIFSSPALYQDPHRLYVATLRGSLFSLSPESGETHWQYKCGKPLFSSPCVTPDGVCIGCTDGCLYYISHQGRQLWSFPTGGPIFSSPAVLLLNTALSNPSVEKKEETECFVIGSHDCHAYCVTSHGHLIWKVKVDSPVYSTPFPCWHRRGSESDCEHSSGAVNSQGYFVHKVDMTNLKTRCEFSQGSLISSASQKSSVLSQLSQVDQDDLCVSSDRESYNIDSNAVRVNPSDIIGDSKVLVTHKCEGKKIEGLAKSCHQRVGISDLDACDANITTKDSECNNPGCNCFPSCRGDQPTSIAFPSCAGDQLTTVVFAGTTGTLYVVEVGTGAVLCSHCLPGEVFSSPVQCGSQVVVGCRDDNVYCLRLRQPP